MAEQWVTVEQLKASLIGEMAQEEVDAYFDQHAERERERRLGVDPSRVIDGETVRKEIEGG